MDMPLGRVVAWAAMAAIAAACSLYDPVTEPADGGGSTVTLRDGRCEYEGLSQMREGTITMAFINDTGVDAQFDIDVWLLDEGHTYDELAAHIDEDRRRGESGESPLGHPDFATLVAQATADGTFGELAFPAQPGTYGIACVLFGESGGIWAAGPFTVTAE